MGSLLEWIDRLDKAAAQNYFLFVHNPSIESVAAVFSNEYLHLLWFVPMVGWIFYHRPRTEAIAWTFGWLFSVIIASALIDLGKDWIARPRPVTWLGIALEMPAGSWPSAHSGNSYAIATITYLFFRIPGFIAFAFAICTALSRFFLLKHYPSDIFSGALIGMAVAALTYPLAIRAASWLVDWLGTRFPERFAFLQGDNLD